MSELALIIEALIFASDQPVRTSFLLEVINEVNTDSETPQPTINEEEASESANTEVPVKYDETLLQAVLEELTAKYQSETVSFELKKIAGGYQFFTKPAFHTYVKRATLQQQQKRLSRAALETLSIVAYRQPVTKAEIEFIRGVNCDYAVNKLLEKKLVAITGRSEAPGRPLLYSTSEEFMQYFGISDISELPKLKEFDEMDEEILMRFSQATPDNASEEEKYETDESQKTESTQT